MSAFALLDAAILQSTDEFALTKDKFNKNKNKNQQADESHDSNVGSLNLYFGSRFCRHNTSIRSADIVDSFDSWIVQVCHE